MATSVPESFYKEFVTALHEGTAAVFAGAGLSRSAGFVDWRGLLRDIATDLELDVDVETDLLGVAQFHENKYKTRTQLNRAIIEEFTKDAKLTDNHRLIANLPIETVWTTNYDDLIEQAFKLARKRVDAKIAVENLVSVRPGRAVTVYKMHGDVTQPHNAVITKEDYETYDLPHNRELFSIKLKGDLVGRSFLFLGFSFTDPNIDYILSRVRALLGKNTGTHFCVMRRAPKPKGGKGKKLAQYEYDTRKQELRNQDLLRYGIRPIMVDDYSEVTDILREINRRIHLRDVFVSGSAFDYAPLGKQRVEGLATMIGRKLIDVGCNLVSGVGLGIGGQVVIGALESLYGADAGSDQEHRMDLRPFPQHAMKGKTVPETWAMYREDMLAKAGSVIFLAGNKEVDGKTVVANGVFSEFEIAKRRKLFPIPIGATGHAAEAIWKEVGGALDTFYPAGGVKAQFAALGDPNKTNEQLVDAVVAILKHVKAF